MTSKEALIAMDTLIDLDNEFCQIIVESGREKGVTEHESQMTWKRTKWHFIIQAKINKLKKHI